jgi:phosphoribosylformylglycinamidine cyclo-ligase
MGRKKEQESKTGGLTYRDAGVDIDAQDRALDGIKKLVRGTRTAGVRSDLGSFGGLFEPDTSGLDKPLLVSSCDGVGTKLRVAFETGVHNTVGRDLVNHCVNDILVQGARPLFFMDYLATGLLQPGVVTEVVEGVATGCREVNCALLGGEIAEMPGFYSLGEYDIAGFIVGMVDGKLLIDGARIEDGNVLIGLPSAGLHTNGYSLARKIFFELAGLKVADHVEELGATVGELLLAEHRCYLTQLSLPISENWIRGMAHITGGGLTDNIPRILPAGLSAQLSLGSWPVTGIFEFLQREGNVADDEMYRAFNMGIGMVLVADPDEAVLCECYLDRLDQPHYRIGEIVAGEGQVVYV